MNNKIFLVSVLSIIAITGGFIILKDKPPVERPGVALANNGQKHVASKDYGGSEPPTSGDHAEPLQWQAYTQEIRDDNVIHNMEHGGIYISYRPDLPPEQVSKLKSLFFPPYSKDGFSPTKAIMAPRSNNKAPIVISSWTRNQKIEIFDEEVLVQYYLLNVGKSPEPNAS